MKRAYPVNAMLKPEEAEIKAFVAERDEVLLACDVDRMIALHTKYNPGSRTFISREIAEIALHKARTVAKSLPIESRLASKRWLSERGYSSLDDGDLLS